ncbi:hypothetical protein C8R46DRAFT_1272894, partial [Mycena filopes]
IHLPRESREPCLTTLSSKAIKTRPILPIKPVNPTSLSRQLTFYDPLHELISYAMLSTTFISLAIAIVGSAPLLANASPLLDVTVTATATVTRTRTIFQCPTASPVLNFADPPVVLPTPSPSGSILSGSFGIASGIADPLVSGASSLVANVLPTASPAVNIVLSVVSSASAAVDSFVDGATSRVRDPLGLPSGVLSLSASDILPTSVLSSAIVLPTDANRALALVEGLKPRIDAIIAQLNAVQTLVANVAGGLSQLTGFISTLSSRTDSLSIAMQNIAFGLYGAPIATDSAADDVRDATTKSVKTIETTVRKIGNTLSTVPRGTDTSAMRLSVQNLQTSATNALTALRLQCGTSGQMASLDAAKKLMDEAFNKCLVQV